MFVSLGQGWEELSHLLRDAGGSSLAAEAGVLSARSWDLLLPQPGGRRHSITSSILRRWREWRLRCPLSVSWTSTGRRLRYNRKEWRRGLPAPACCDGDPALQPWGPVSNLSGSLFHPAPGQRLLPDTWGDIPEEALYVFCRHSPSSVTTVPYVCLILYLSSVSREQYMKFVRKKLCGCGKSDH